MFSDPGANFGEVALLSEDNIRNASIVTDRACDFLVIDRDLFNRCLKVRVRGQIATLFERKEMFYLTTHSIKMLRLYSVRHMVKILSDV